ncbi:CD48 antigen isoform X2 [Electrophorus electricus]|uniref:CD48 antigen isoform X2 n=1 Tax=Electrophorus electricus TaxID=8005 RepID=UPI0015D08B9A|nr:CD48 antigen isoform X2 [Electrophorus electricus]
MKTWFQCTQWTLLFICVSDVFIFAAGSSTSTERVVMYSTVGKSLTFPTRVPLTGTIHYEGRNIGVVLNKNTDTETDEKFKNRLHWDNQTGLFTLSDLRTEDSGGYTVESSKESKIKQEYQLEVYKNVPAPQVTSSSNSSSDNTVCSLLCSVINGRGLVLFWYKDNFILNRTSSSNLNAILHLPLEIEKPKNDNFICVVSNPVSNKTTTANITTLCYHSPVHGDGRQRYIVSAVLSGVSVVAVIGVAVYLRRRKWQKESSQHTEGLYT